MTQVTESFPELEKFVVELEALSLKERFWLVDRLMQGIRSQTLQESSVERVVDSAELTGSQIEIVDGVLVVKPQGSEPLNLDLVAFINQQREERIQAVGGW